MQHVVVVGGGLAGYQAAVALRRDGYAGRLTLVGEEAHRPYDRPPLSKEMLRGVIDPARCFYSCDGLDVEWRLGEAATGLAVASRLLRLASGEDLSFDGLVIATGRRARQCPEHVRLGGMLTLRSLDDALALQKAAQPGCRVAILGAGFIGCEVAATLSERGVRQVTLIDVARYPMPALGPEIGQRVATLHAAHGVRLRMNTSVAAFEGRDRVTAVHLSSGERVPADLVLLAIGSIPNSEWLRESGLDLCWGAVRCDEHGLVVGTGNIVAAGDVAAFPHASAGSVVSIEHWSNAREMGATAASNLLLAPDERKPFVPVPSFWSDQYDVKIKSVGLVPQADRFDVVSEDSETASVVVEAHRDGELVGAVALNENLAIGRYQRQLALASAT